MKFLSDDTRYAAGDDIQYFLNMGPAALFVKYYYQFWVNVFKKKRKFHTFTYIYRLPTRSSQKVDLMYGFGTQTRRIAKMTANKFEKRKFFLRINFKDFFGLADQGT